jgi:hypothetical protein
LPLQKWHPCFKGREFQSVFVQRLLKIATLIAHGGDPSRNRLALSAKSLEVPALSF